LPQLNKPVHVVIDSEEILVRQIKRTFETALNQQYPCPQGVMGRIAGELMVRQHTKETAWTVALAEVQPTDHVLEIGFGAGKAIALLAEIATRGFVAGVDLSPTMVKRAQKRNAPGLRAGRVTLLQGEAALLPFENRQFDRVVSIHTFYFWSDPLAVLTECFRVLKPGGRLVITLATGKTEETRKTGLEQLIAEQVLPHMRSIGYRDVSSIFGPVSRQFRILALVGARPSDAAAG
jgi:ubiquinone/menaquinone biosynthesis C-methylase UbiE